MKIKNTDFYLMLLNIFCAVVFYGISYWFYNQDFLSEEMAREARKGGGMAGVIVALLYSFTVSIGEIQVRTIFSAFLFLLGSVWIYNFCDDIFWESNLRKWAITIFLVFIIGIFVFSSGPSISE